MYERLIPHIAHVQLPLLVLTGFSHPTSRVMGAPVQALAAVYVVIVVIVLQAGCINSIANACNCLKWDDHENWSDPRPNQDK